MLRLWMFMTARTVASGKIDGDTICACGGTCCVAMLWGHMLMSVHVAPPPVFDEHAVDI